MKDMKARIETALGAMSSGPRPLTAYLAQPGPDFAKVTSAQVGELFDMILAADPNAQARLRFSTLLRSWDNTKAAPWIADTARNSAARREVIHRLLRTTGSLAQRIDTAVPFFRLDEPVIIAEKHVDWYAPQPGIRDYYWATYLRYLRERRRWPEESLLNLDNSTRAIVECLAKPEAAQAYASRGLVMGYVQSGKTANFMGVAARAADAGYRLIIVLAGTWNILRNQTQRRFDKELLGKELLRNDENYQEHQPPDWDEFLEHGTDPLDLGQFTWQRLTRPDIDFRRLRAAIDNLEFERANPALPIYDPANLHRLPAKLLVVKKHSGILQNLVRDLKIIRTRLADLPTLIIDDESDQAGLNTVDPKEKVGSEQARSETNKRIVALLGLFPRGQYVGYTATPFANALVDPSDPEDLFPRDFIVSLDRPRGYMGVSDFFDPTTTHADLNKDDFSQREIAFIRRVARKVDGDDEDLEMALRSYVLAGAIKLFRHDREPQRYESEQFKHHTMLIHTSNLRGVHASLAGRLNELWDQCVFNSPRGQEALRKLWTNDYSKVCRAHGKELNPQSFRALVPYLAESIKRIENGPKVFLVVNSDNSEAPDFSAASVWKIIVGGNKLSRGYTVEGLTVSYYRRVARTGDTLMQMGRWFGFRPGYRDLVRVFLGVREGKKEDADLVALFKEVCRREERFREEIRRYTRRPGMPRITPKQIPPLISISGTLPPTARNKMFNAIFSNKNFGGQRSMLTLTAAKKAGLDANIKALNDLLASCTLLGRQTLKGTTSALKTLKSDVFLLDTGSEHIVNFLEAYHWLEADYPYPERPTDTALQLEFLRNQKHEIESWLLMLPQRKNSFGNALKVRGLGSVAVKERGRVAGRGFQVFGEPTHRTFAEFLSGIEPGKTELARPGLETKRLLRPHLGVVLLYPVREVPQAPVSIGFELYFPPNKLPFEMNLTVSRPSDESQVIIATKASSKAPRKRRRSGRS